MCDSSHSTLWCLGLPPLLSLQPARLDPLSLATARGWLAAAGASTGDRHADAPPCNRGSPADTPQALTLLAWRLALWRWPGAHSVLLSLASAGALGGVSVYDGSGALRRTLKLSRQGVSTAFYRALGSAQAPLLDAGDAGAQAGGFRAPGVDMLAGGLAGVANALEQAAGMETMRGPAAPENSRRVSFRITAADGPARPGAGGSGGGDEPAPDEGMMSRAAAQVALDCLGLAGGEIGE